MVNDTILSQDYIGLEWSLTTAESIAKLWPVQLRPQVVSAAVALILIFCAILGAVSSFVIISVVEKRKLFGTLELPFDVMTCDC